MKEPLELEPRERPHRRARRRSRRRGGALRIALRTVAVAVVFLLGIVVGRALEDAPKPGGLQTIVRTLKSSTLEPVRTVVVTVTTAR